MAAEQSDLHLKNQSLSNGIIDQSQLQLIRPGNGWNLNCHVQMLPLHQQQQGRSAISQIHCGEDEGRPKERSKGNACVSTLLSVGVRAGNGPGQGPQN
jgi:hypothetical protein